MLNAGIDIKKLLSLSFRTGSSKAATKKLHPKKIGRRSVTSIAEVLHDISEGAVHLACDNLVIARSIWRLPFQGESEGERDAEVIILRWTDNQAAAAQSMLLNWMQCMQRINHGCILN
jgi:hypothetical protein